jgi:hypothetical protein
MTISCYFALEIVIQLSLSILLFSLASWKRVHDPSHGRESEGWRLLHLCLSVPPKLSSSQALSVHAWTRLHVSASERLRAWIAGGYERDKV